MHLYFPKSPLNINLQLFMFKFPNNKVLQQLFETFYLLISELTHHLNITAPSIPAEFQKDNKLQVLLAVKPVHISKGI